ncbi:hypothetical protein AYO44_05575 [Planctomycetaceae bacterium SCGC AG-212-F19]|nr:hypothetical protein AYO44_05575 [Planctomycetaceae bacterium SCGC AG-212-F19]
MHFLFVAAPLLFRHPAGIGFVLLPEPLGLRFLLPTDGFLLLPRLLLRNLVLPLLFLPLLFFIPALQIVVAACARWKDAEPDHENSDPETLPKQCHESHSE